MIPSLRRLAVLVAATLGWAALLSACAATTATVEDEASQAARDRTPPTSEDATDAPAETEAAPAPPTIPDPEPVPFRPSGPVGSADAYNELIANIEAELPREIHADVPWPDLRNPDPARVQVQIFDLWIWVIENHPDSVFAEAMAVADSPSREEIAGVFGEIQFDNELHVREGSPYVAFDHRVVTFESAGLPLWLARNVPADAVVVYYKDQSGMTTVRDRDTGEVLDLYGGPDARQWLSIMVPTEAGWMLFRDQLIEPGNAELEVPPVPDETTTDPRTDV